MRAARRSVLLAALALCSVLQAVPVRAATPASCASAAPPAVSQPASGARIATPSPPTPAAACSGPDQKLLDQVRKQLGVQLALAMTQQRQLSLSIQINQEQQQRLQAQITASDRKVVTLDAEVERLQVQIDDTTQKVEDERAQLTVLAKALYAQPTSVLVLAAQSHGLDDLMTRTSRLMVAADRAHSAKIRLEADLVGLNAMHDQKQSDLDAERSAATLLQEQLSQLRQIQLEAQVLVGRLMQQIIEIRSELQAVGGSAPELTTTILAGLNNAQLAALTASSQQVWSQVQVWSQLHPQPVGAPLGGSLHLLLPVAGAVLTQPFGPSPYAFEPAYGGFPHFHQGADLAAPLDTPVTAAYPGVVAVVGSDPWGYGNYVVIAHGGDLTTLSAHLDMALVQPGKEVKAGDVIGLEGSTGNSTGPHVHFELRLKGVPQDPLPYLPPVATG